MLLAWAQILTLPLDASSSRGGNEGGLEMDIMWQVIYMLVFIFVLFLIPPAMFYMEVDGDEDRTVR
jgi:LMBR1 domain-containing protein 1